jgi:histidine triad (HIT) family protein
MSDANCLFCRIASHQMNADIVAETPELVAIKDTNPQAPTHVLIIPKEHIPTLADATDGHTTLLGNAFQLANHLARQAHLVQGGYRVVVNTGAQAGQSVFHLHIHLLGGRPFRWPPG